jgi:hypothetical protein
MWLLETVNYKGPHPFAKEYKGNCEHYYPRSLHEILTPFSLENTKHMAASCFPK